MSRILSPALLRSRWAAVGAAVAVTLGAGGLALAHASTSSAGAQFHALAPVRVFDTRTGDGGVPVGPVGADATLDVTIGGTHGVPLDATAVVLNVTVVGGTTSSFLTAWPTGAVRPTASVLNWTNADATPNGVTVPLGTAGKVSFYNKSGTVNVLADVAGYFTAATGPQFANVVTQTVSGPALPATLGSISSVDLTLPDACPAAPDQWQVLVQADGYFLTGGAASGGSATVALSTDGTNFVSGSVLNQNITSPGQWREPFSTSFLFTVDAGTTTFSVLGSTNIGAGVSAAQLNVIAQSVAVVC